MNAKRARSAQNDELIEMLFTQKDCVSRATAYEIIRRGEELTPALSDIVMDKWIWTADSPDWWAPVHATYLLGAIGGQDVLSPLLSSLRWSDAYDNEWVTEDLPSILGSLGKISYDVLMNIATDASSGWSARSIAIDSLGSQAVRFPEVEDNIMILMNFLLTDKDENIEVKKTAACVLMDFCRSDYQKSLIGFAKAEGNRLKLDPDYTQIFSIFDVKKKLAFQSRDIDFYIHNWLAFYESEEVRNRQLCRGDEYASEFNMRMIEAPKNRIVISRNDPCPCGSGRPYKKCCFKKIH